MRTSFYLTLTIILLSFLQARVAYGQSYRLPLLEIQFTDSLEVNDSVRFLNNTIRLINKSILTRDLTLDFFPPGDWRALSSRENLNLKPGDTAYVPLNIVASPQVKATWKNFTIRLTEKGNTDTADFTFRVKAKERNFFFCVLTQKRTRLLDNKNPVNLKFYVVNAGNTVGNYRVEYRNPALEMDKNSRFSLDPQKDTTYNWSFQITDEKWKTFRKEQIFIRITDTSGMRRVMMADVYKISPLIKEHPSAYQVIPLRLEAGYMIIDKNSSYFAALSGEIDLAKNRRIDFQFRTKQFGLGNNLHRNVLNLTYSSPKLELFLGQGSSSRLFITDGTTGTGKYTPRKDLSFSFGTTIHTSTSYYKTDHFEAGVNHLIKKIRFDHTIAFNHNISNKVNGYLLVSKVGIINKEKIKLDIELGTGIDDYQYILPAHLTEKPGFGYGYELNLLFKKWMLSSSIRRNDRKMPGIYKDAQSQNHNVKFTLLKTITMGGFYFSNYTSNNFLLDTIYNSTVLSYNVIRYGLTTGWSTKGLSLNVDAGKLNQVGLIGSGLTKYDYFDFRASYAAGKYFRTSINALKGFGRLDPADKRSQPLELVNLGGNIQYRQFSIAAFFLSDPLINVDTSKFTFLGYQKSLFFTPSIGFMLLKKMSLNFSYTISRSLYDNTNTSFAGTQLSYNDYRKGIELNVYGTIPVKKSKAIGFGLSNQYVTVSLVKKINMPLLTNRKYYDLKVVMYLDENNNKILDAPEKLMKGMQVNINDLSFITNKNGSLLYKNIPRGKYLLDFTESEGLKGWVPALGSEQEVVLTGSSTIYVGYKKSKLISGKINIQRDTTSAFFFAEGLKVSATDSSGRYFSTLCNEEGEFFLNVPSGFYTVSLNPAAFNERAQPEVMSFKIDLINNQEQTVDFLIKQQKRKIRLLNSN